MKIRVLTAAINDLEHGRLFYQQQGEHLGDYFLDALFSDIDSLVIYAGIHQQVFGYYRMLARRFPYAIYYRMPKPNEVVVWRVLDMRAKPAKTVKRLNI
ncbi:type II toxin-antitoxin system RelE/ParE family toxin [Rheinheimera aquimaris]|uniref:type II toxin-antitoxin system RelE/ParE family toxin n=1 Tax=Rheinheimera aquimaris TaxID=412437 RepID=UPI0032B24680|tara:strand:+ start:178 stop:474 length:297 start_codon:yes stop_codon:yes gene_type:complete